MVLMTRVGVAEAEAAGLEESLEAEVASGRQREAGWAARAREERRTTRSGLEAAAAATAAAEGRAEEAEDRAEAAAREAREVAVRLEECERLLVETGTTGGGAGRGNWGVLFLVLLFFMFGSAGIPADLLLLVNGELMTVVTM